MELDGNLNIVLLNSVAENAFQVKEKEVLGRHISDFLSQDTFPHLRNLTRELSAVKKGVVHRWVPEILTAVCTDGSTPKRLIWKIASGFMFAMPVIHP